MTSNIKTSALIVVTLVIVMFVAFGLQKYFGENNFEKEFSGVNPNSVSAVKIGETEIPVLKAITAKEKLTGLSGRDSLLPNQGMLFFFNSIGDHLIWMKDMKFSIDIVWIDENYEIVHVEKNISPETYPEVFGPDAPSLYVLELPAGFSDTHGVTVGDKVEFLSN